MDIGQAVFDVIANPNVAYALLILGLLTLVVAFTVPGTGVLEVAAALCLILALLGLSRLPVNIAGLVLILAGIGMFIADVKLQSGLVALAGAVTLGVGSLFLFRPDERAFAVSWWLVLLVTGGSAIFFGLGMHRAIRAMQSRPVMAPENILGERGVIKSPLTAEANFTGTALIDSELWTVKSDESVSEGTPVVVVQAEGLTLFVRALPPSVLPPTSLRMDKVEKAEEEVK